MAIDWETSGYSIPNYAEKHSGISFGATIFDVSTFEVIDTLYLEIQPDPTKLWSAEAERVHGLSQVHLAKKGVTREEAATQLATLVLTYIGTDKILTLGHRVYFDIAFTDELMKTIDVKFDWDPIKLDSAAIATVFLNETSSDGLFSLCGFDERSEHNALEDILLTLESVKTLKQTFLKGQAR